MHSIPYPTRHETQQTGFALWTRLALWADYLLIAGSHVWLLSYGIASIVTTLSLYITVALAAWWLSQAPWARARSMALGLATLAIGLFVIELVLRYGVAAHQSYLEQQGSFFHYSLYGGHKLNNHTKQLFGFADLHLHIKQPHSSSVAKNDEFSFVSRYNSLGLREKEIPVRKATHELRLVTIGDSFTEGIGADQSSTWPRHLERALQSRYRYGKVSVINGGIGGSDPFFGYVLLERRLIRYQPDVVVVTLNTSDIFDVVKRGGTERFRAGNSLRFRDGPWWEPLYSTSYIVRHLVHDLLGLNWWLLSAQQTEHETARALALIRSCLQDFVNLTTQRGAALVVVVHPMSHQISGNHQLFDQLLATAKDDPDLRVLDLRDYFLRKTNIADNVWEYYWPIDRHHNEQGYRLFADGVMQGLSSSLPPAGD